MTWATGSRKKSCAFEAAAASVPFTFGPSHHANNIARSSGQRGARAKTHFQADSVLEIRIGHDLGGNISEIADYPLTAHRSGPSRFADFHRSYPAAACHLGKSRNRKHRRFREYAGDWMI